MNKKYAWSDRFALALAGTVALGAGVAALGCGGDDSTNCSTVTADAGTDKSPIPKTEGGADSNMVLSSNLGKACTADADCGAPFTCLTSVNSGANSVANGVCSLNCNALVINQNAASDVCGPYGAFCIDFSRPTDSTPDAWCMESCNIGDPVGGGVGVPSKCHARDDLACFPSQDGSGQAYCTPMCVSDDDCKGKKCDPLSGLCVPQVVEEDPLGSHCTPDMNGKATECEFCLSLVDTSTSGQTTTVASFCSAFCRLLTPGGCSFGPPVGDGGGPTGACLYPVDPSSGPGDLGYCAQLCDVDADCRNQTDHFICDKSAVQNIGRGICTLADQPDGGDAGTDAAPDASSDAGTPEADTDGGSPEGSDNDAQGDGGAG